jgi:hypothetical protein
LKIKKKVKEFYKNIQKRYFGILDNNGELLSLIEYNGKQHYNFIEKFHKNEEEFLLSKQRDQMKIDYCLKKGIPLLIIKYNENMDYLLKKSFSIIK